MLGTYRTQPVSLYHRPGTPVNGYAIAMAWLTIFVPSDQRAAHHLLMTQSLVGVGLPDRAAARRAVF
ncbi:hypothetical protein [Sodalis-like endosymbiont of Proechinophthirus fluctus]|uniref:hypothetical protein n=1 Tax=Sodalis-like endosymbiont of Proechinophthirus fluctus TaxID=1462730 RepID=UPI001FCBDCE2|nr:hypothetical protein [Sodalis-like endosymbiont of Proechinophthirus fluctus]